jgi:ATP-dependent helicase Lhr and Lhr-like helicase
MTVIHEGPMTIAFDRLSPALAVQIVNGLGWTSLREVQNQSIHAILDGRNAVILAPTAGGKTEASLFPLLSLMDSEDRAATSVLYIAPIRALLNNQEARLEKLTGLIGRTAFKWHGDVSQSARKRFIRTPADILAITPESLEAMLMSSRVPGKRLLSHVRAVVIDEVHAFAQSDRGSHLVAVLERIQRICGHDIQRIGLSATVGDPEAIADWLCGSSARPRIVVNPGAVGAPPEVHLDYVGSLENAAHVIHKLWPGTRRLVFVDSRRRVEELASMLLARGVDTFISHSSLAVSDRTAAERAFEERDNCVIVATSALELGIDVGDLDRVVQIDAPSTVSSFLQRMGRTGRRAGTRANCTFLATSDDAVLQAAGLLRLWEQGYVEPTTPNVRSIHVLAHQLLTLGIQALGIGVADWWRWLDGCAAFDDISKAERDALLQHMLDSDILAEVDSRLVMGRRGEKLYAGANFRELYAVFSVPPVLRVLHGRQEVGSVDAWFAQQDGDHTSLAFVLGGKAWQVNAIDWRRAVCHVTPAAQGTYPRWMGSPVLLSEALCQAMRDVLVQDSQGATWSKRAHAVMEELRQAHPFLHDGPAPLVSDTDRVKWWTFAGGRANNLLATLLKKALGDKVTSNNLCVTLTDGAASSDVAIRQAIAALGPRLTWANARALAPESARGRISKFQPCLPEHLERDLLARSLLDVQGAARAAGMDPSWVDAVEHGEEMRRELRASNTDLRPDETLALDSRRARTPAVQPKLPVTIIDTFEALDRLCPQLMKAEAIGFDVETTMQHELCLAQVGTRDGTWLIDAVVIDDLSPLTRLLESPRVVKIIQYASFERNVMQRLGIEINNVFDTHLASKKRRGNLILGGHSLGMICERELGIMLDKGEQTSDWRRRPLSESQTVYAALDVEVLLPLYDVLQ